MTKNEAKKLKKKDRVRLTKWFKYISGTVTATDKIGFEVEWDDGMVSRVAFEDANNITKE